MTIYALSSGPGVSGIAVIRISGPETSKAIELPSAIEINWEKSSKTKDSNS